jgi:MFS superfamily sulfate permease-like transporter
MAASLPPVNSTPVGAAAQTAALATIVLQLLQLWPWWARQPTTFTNAVQVLLTGVLAYLAGWLKVRNSQGQRIEMSLTSSPLPTLQQVPVKPHPRGGTAA